MCDLCDIIVHCNKNVHQKFNKRSKNFLFPLKIIFTKVKTNVSMDQYYRSLINTFKSCLKILTQDEKINEEDALRNMSWVIILKMIEKHLLDKIKIDKYNYDLEDSEKKRLLELVRFSKLINEKEDDMVNIITDLWNNILSVHPSTKNIFLKGESFDIKKGSTFKKLLKKINEIQETNYDTLGNAYEEILKDMIRKEKMGQYFTPPFINEIMINLVRPKLYENGSIDTCADPTMGTGGLLLSYMKDIIKQSQETGIPIDWENFKDSFYGKEIKRSTYQLAVSNVLIHTGHYFENSLFLGDSIKEHTDKKFDCILANPPFSIKIDLREESYKNVNVPIKTKSSELIFIQLIINMLKIEGRCAVVLPNGGELFANNKLSSRFREYLLKTCDLQEIIHLEKGSFSSTGIATCIFYFIKKTENVDKLMTPSVNFFRYEHGEKKLIIKVSGEDILKNNYSLRFNNYLKNDQFDTSGMNTKTIGEICEHFPRGERLTGYGKDHGKYPFFQSSMKLSKYVDIPDYNEECIIIGCGASANIHYSSSFSANLCCHVLKKINEDVNLKYVYFYILFNLEKLNCFYEGMGLKFLSLKNLKSFRIPFPSSEKQKEIVDFLENNIEVVKNLEKEIEKNKECARRFMKNPT